MAGVFREKSLERAASPESLDDYIQVSNPSVWMVLIAILLLLAGGFVWACFANLSDEQPCTIAVSGNTAACYVDQANAEYLSEGDEVTVAGTTGTVLSVSADVVPLSGLPGEAQDAAADGTEWFYWATVSLELPEGVYEGEVTTRSYRPLALLFGQE